MKNNDNFGHYSVVDMVHDRRRAGHEGPAMIIQAAWSDNGISEG
jgi:hypothetical protein